MISKQQKIALAVVGATATAVFGPTLLQQTQHGGDTSGMVPSGPTAEEMEAMTVSVDGPEPLLSGAGRAPAAGLGSRSGAPGSSSASPSGGTRTASRDELGGLLDRLESFGATGRVRSLDEIASEWSTVAGAATAPGQTVGAAAASGDGLGDFLLANPLRATFVFADEAVALLGPHTVRVGSELLDGQVVVAKVEPQRVTLSVRGVPRIVELPPVRAVARTQGSNAAEGGAAGAADLSASGGLAPNAPAAVTPDVP